MFGFTDVRIRIHEGDRVPGPIGARRPASTVVVAYARHDLPGGVRQSDALTAVIQGGRRAPVADGIRDAVGVSDEVFVGANDEVGVPLDKKAIGKSEAHAVGEVIACQIAGIRLLVVDFYELETPRDVR